MQNKNFSVYAQGCIYPEDGNYDPAKKAIGVLKSSGFKTAILGLFHIGRNFDISPSQNLGDIYFNNTLVISEGEYVGDSNWPALVQSMLDGSVTTLCASIGGGYPVMDYQTIKRIYLDNGNSFNNTNLMDNFTCMRETFPGISIIDMDCEETYNQESFVAFCQMLGSLGFDITFCPYNTQGFWINSLQQLNTSNPGLVKWWNLQCYDGGEGNDPAIWASAIQQQIPGFSTDGFILPGDWTDDSPSEVKQLMSTFKNDSSVGGGFIWTLDLIIDSSYSATDYVKAISTGLANESVNSFNLSTAELALE